ncbi:MAG: YraN family protein [Chloroflexi bacterium AL-W]|nr:YraN family protein [Chloroflexi bacterium AL-N1]NOK66945.1 YraN family protein [Chloroflexi bacterium AL-N10]NOK74763.1 YraN family protein [Chloroflexi bacterium AL-N5]NOK81547.1 YraN family protein [Chloroflexi bacterium AL-W]NOK89017.1 YraN family protein [Chloroflexi bacterium AL-N15]
MGHKCWYDSAMTHTRKRLGDFGEQVAKAHLIRKGMSFIAHQWRCSEGEIDLIMRDGAVLVFVEVRTRRSHIVGIAAESITPQKQVRLITLAYTYLTTCVVSQEAAWRIDVVTVELDRQGRVVQCLHILHAIEEH